MTFSFWDAPFFCHELLTLSASFTESTVSNMNRFGTAGEKTQAEEFCWQGIVCTYNRHL